VSFEGIAFATEGGGGINVYIRDVDRQEDECLRKTNSPSVMG